ncbi:MAG: YjbQ family protein [Anaerolineae bacterium]
MKTITLQTTHRPEVISVTAQLADLIGEVQEGLAYFSTPHTTAALFLCEDDAELREDIIKTAENMYAPLRPFSTSATTIPTPKRTCSAP